MRLSIRDYETYYNLMKERIRSDPVCEAVEEIMLSVSNNLKHICHCYSKDVTIFDYLGDSIVEGSNASLKIKRVFYVHQPTFQSILQQVFKFKYQTSSQ